jgi:hypothetical protein
MTHVVHAVTGWHGWTWEGWAGLVALGTLALALVTFGLVWMTRGLVRATFALAQQAQADVEAQWVPILTGTPATEGFPNPAVRVEGTEVHIALRNIGRGPVVNLGARIGGTPRNNEYVTIAPGEWTWITVDPSTYPGDLPEVFQVIVRYWDITNRKLYGSRIEIKADLESGSAEMTYLVYEPSV